MSWDDIEVFASDAAAPMTHPIQLIMAADRVVELSSEHEDSLVYCKHPRRLGDSVHVSPVVVNDREPVPLGVYGIQNVPSTSHPRCFERHYWAMGLCACGTLHYKSLWSERYWL